MKNGSLLAAAGHAKRVRENTETMQIIAFIFHFDKCEFGGLYLFSLVLFSQIVLSNFIVPREQGGIE
jgi:hypothetical protein